VSGAGDASGFEVSSAAKAEKRRGLIA